MDEKEISSFRKAGMKERPDRKRLYLWYAQFDAEMRNFKLFRLVDFAWDYGRLLVKISNLDIGLSIHNGRLGFSVSPFEFDHDKLRGVTNDTETNHWHSSLYDPQKNSYWMLPQYLEAIQACGGLPLILPPRLDEEEMAQILNLCQGFLFPGGQDRACPLWDGAVGMVRAQLTPAGPAGVFSISSRISDGEAYAGHLSRPAAV